MLRGNVHGLALCCVCLHLQGKIDSWKLPGSGWVHVGGIVGHMLIQRRIEGCCEIPAVDVLNLSTVMEWVDPRSNNNGTMVGRTKVVPRLKIKYVRQCEFGLAERHMYITCSGAEVCELASTKKQVVVSTASHGLWYPIRFDGRVRKYFPDADVTLCKKNVTQHS